ncbi:hypothetical protein A0J61_11810, partial [Choanephora cucurbitarum]
MTREKFIPCHLNQYTKRLYGVSNRTIVAASAAAVVGVISGYPFDSIKTRLQTQHYDSIGACIKQTYKDEGI